MKIDIQREFVLTVSIEELRLICKALGGRLRDEDRTPAALLDREIATLRIKSAEHEYNEMQKLKENLG